MTMMIARAMEMMRKATTLFLRALRMGGGEWECEWRSCARPAKERGPLLNAPTSTHRAIMPLRMRLLVPISESMPRS